MSDENNDHPCFECARKGEGGATYDFPHPAVKCIVDNHRSLDILGDLKTCLDGLYKECPKNKEDHKVTVYKKICIEIEEDIYKQIKRTAVHKDTSVKKLVNECLKKEYGECED